MHLGAGETQPLQSTTPSPFPLPRSRIPRWVRELVHVLGGIFIQHGPGTCCPAGQHPPPVGAQLRDTAARRAGVTRYPHSEAWTKLLLFLQQRGVSSARRLETTS